MQEQTQTIELEVLVPVYRLRKAQTVRRRALKVCLRVGARALSRSGVLYCDINGFNGTIVF